MLVKQWEDLPFFMQKDAVLPYFEILKKKWFGLTVKRAFDILASLLFLLLFIPLFLILAILIKIDSPGPVFYRQERVTQFGKHFRIFKFRTMVVDADMRGPSVTVDHDPRVTPLGHFIRKNRLDEIPQLLNILDGEMTFVGTRPEVPKYVEQYSDEMESTLLLPAGVTSKASIEFKDEEKLLANTSDVDGTYVYEVLPKKMKMNLEYEKEENLLSDFQVLLLTISSMVGKTRSETKKTEKKDSPGKKNLA
jgi:lipopolysaccharide/colanic/teichoic acid biosynthesis glycosyltransferase